jgi:hypothetical protein
MAKGAPTSAVDFQEKAHIAFEKYCGLELEGGGEGQV